MAIPVSSSNVSWQDTGAGSPSAIAKANRDKAFGLTSGISDKIMQDAQMKAALDRLQAATKEGPLSQSIQTQMANRNAGMLARAEGVNAEQLRSDAANSGLSPDDPGYQAALRQGQAQRQSGQIAFAGDLASRAAMTNYGAQNDSARALAATRLNQYGQAQPGYGWAANLYADTNVGGQRTSAVTAPQPSGSSSAGGGGAGVAFSSTPLNDPWSRPAGGVSTIYRSGGKDVTETQYNQDRAAGRGMTNMDGTAFQPGQVNPVGGTIFKSNLYKQPTTQTPTTIPNTNPKYGPVPFRD